MKRLIGRKPLADYAPPEHFGCSRHIHGADIEIALREATSFRFQKARLSFSFDAFRNDLNPKLTHKSNSRFVRSVWTIQLRSKALLSQLTGRTSKK